MGPAELFQEALRLQQSGQLAEAESAYRRIIQLQPNHVDAHINLGAAVADLGRFAEAIRIYQAAQRLAPTNWLLHVNLGWACSQAGQLEAAIAAYEQALNGCPDRVHVLHNLGVALLNANRLNEARLRWDEALQLDSADAKLWFHLGVAQARLGQLNVAQDSARRALDLKPDYGEAHNLLGAIFGSLNRDAEAEAHLREAIRLRPDYSPALNNYALKLTEAGRLAESIALFRRALAIGPKNPNDHSNLLLALNYASGVTPAEMLSEHRAWAALYADALAPPTPPLPAAPRPDGRLRVGYVSADYRAHPVGWFLSAILPHHNRARFHITGYANVETPDQLTEQLRGLVDSWRWTHGRPDDEVARMIREDGIDILVDLGGHTNNNRLLVFAQQPAPVQVTLLGYPNATGLKAMQYRISDPISDPVGLTEAWYTEQIVRLPEISWCFARPADLPPVSALPFARAGHVTFGSVNNLAKVTDEVVAAWVEILRALPNSRLVLLVSRTETGRLRAESLFRAAGIAPERVQLIARLPRLEYFGLFERIDVALDPFPYNGALTTGDTLWMGVPVVTLAGTTCRGRQGVCLLTHVGLTDFIAENVGDYVRIATRCGGEPQRLQELRACLRDWMARSPIAQCARFTAYLEDAYRRMWAEKTSR